MMIAFEWRATNVAVVRNAGKPNALPRCRIRIGSRFLSLFLMWLFSLELIAAKIRPGWSGRRYAMRCIICKLRLWICQWAVLLPLRDSRNGSLVQKLRVSLWSFTVKLSQRVASRLAHKSSASDSRQNPAQTHCPTLIHNQKLLSIYLRFKIYFLHSDYRRSPAKCFDHYLCSH